MTSTQIAPFGPRGSMILRSRGPAVVNECKYSIQFGMVIAYIVSLDLCLVLCRRCFLFWKKPITPGLNCAAKGFFENGWCKHIWFKRKAIVPSDGSAVNPLDNWNKQLMFRIGDHSFIRILEDVTRERITDFTIGRCVWQQWILGINQQVVSSHQFWILQ